MLNILIKFFKHSLFLDRHTEVVSSQNSLFTGLGYSDRIVFYGNFNFYDLLINQSPFFPFECPTVIAEYRLKNLHRKNYFNDSNYHGFSIFSSWDLETGVMMIPLTTFKKVLQNFKDSIRHQLDNVSDKIVDLVKSARDDPTKVEKENVLFFNMYLRRNLARLREDVDVLSNHKRKNHLFSIYDLLYGNSSTKRDFYVDMFGELESFENILCAFLHYKKKTEFGFDTFQEIFKGCFKIKKDLFPLIGSSWIESAIDKLWGHRFKNLYDIFSGQVGEKYEIYYENVKEDFSKKRASLIPKEEFFGSLNRFFKTEANFPKISVGGPEIKIKEMPFEKDLNPHANAFMKYKIFCSASEYKEFKKDNFGRYSPNVMFGYMGLKKYKIDYGICYRLLENHDLKLREMLSENTIELFDRYGVEKTDFQIVRFMLNAYDRMAYDIFENVGSSVRERLVSVKQKTLGKIYVPGLLTHDSKFFIAVNDLCQRAGEISNLSHKLKVNFAQVSNDLQHDFHPLMSHLNTMEDLMRCDLSKATIDRLRNDFKEDVKAIYGQWTEHEVLIPYLYRDYSMAHRLMVNYGGFCKEFKNRLEKKNEELPHLYHALNDADDVELSKSLNAKEIELKRPLSFVEFFEIYSRFLPISSIININADMIPDKSMKRSVLMIEDVVSNTLSTAKNFFEFDEKKMVPICKLFVLSNIGKKIGQFIKENDPKNELAEDIGRRLMAIMLSENPDDEGQNISSKTLNLMRMLSIEDAESLTESAKAITKKITDFDGLLADDFDWTRDSSDEMKEFLKLFRSNDSRFSDYSYLDDFIKFHEDEKEICDILSGKNMVVNMINQCASNLFLPYDVILKIKNNLLSEKDIEIDALVDALSQNSPDVESYHAFKNFVMNKFFNMFEGEIEKLATDTLQKMDGTSISFPFPHLSMVPSLCWEWSLPYGLSISVTLKSRFLSLLTFCSFFGEKSNGENIVNKIIGTNVTLFPVLDCDVNLHMLRY